MLKSGGLMRVGILFLSAFSMLQLKSETPMRNLGVFKYLTFRTAVILSLCLYLIFMGSAMILPIFTKTMRGFSDTSSGLATLVGSLLLVIASLSAGKIYDKTGIKPMFMIGTGLYAVYSVMGFQYINHII